MTGTQEKELTSGDIRELRTDDGDIYLYVRGHVDAGSLIHVMHQYFDDDELGEDYEFPCTRDVIYGWARMVPDAESRRVRFEDVGHKVKSPCGIFAYTLVELVANDN